jgi:hypothetical protein
LTVYVSQFVILSHIWEDPQLVAAVLSEMIKESVNTTPATLFVPLGIAAIGEFIPWFLDDDEREQLVDLLRPMMLQFLEKHRCRVQSDIQTYTWSALSHYLNLYYLTHQEIDIPLLRQYLEAALQWDDQPLLDDITRQCALLADVYENEDGALQAMKLLTEIAPDRTRPQLVRALSDLYSRFPELVEDFMIVVKFDSNVQNQIRANVLRSSRDLFYFGGPWALMTLSADTQGNITQQLLWCLRQAPQAQSFGAWVNLFLSAAVNVVCGDEMLKTGQPPLTPLAQGKSN